MPSIAKLSAKLTADSAQFEAAMKNAEKRVEGLDGATKKLGGASRFAKLAGVAAAITFGVHFVTSLAAAEIQTLRTARAMGETVAGLNAMKFLLLDFGGDMEDAASALLIMTRNIAAAVAGNSALADAFKRVKLDAESLNKLTPIEQFKRIAEAVGHIKDKTAQAAIAAQLFGEQAAAVLPILVAGGHAVDHAAKKVAVSGRAIPDKVIAQLERLQILWEDFMWGIAGVSDAFEMLTPFVTELTAGLEETGNLGVWMGAAVKVALRGVAYAVAGLLEVLQLLWFGLKLIKVGALLIAGGWTRMIQKLLETAGKLPDSLGGDKFRAAAEAVKGAGDSVEGALNDAANSAQKSWDALGDSVKGIEAYLDRVDKASGKVGDKVNAKMDGKGALVDLTKNAELYKRGLDIFNDVKSPAEKFRDQLTELNVLVKAGAISWDTYSRASAKALADLESAHQLQNISLSGAIRGNTVEAYSAIVKATQQENMTTRETPAERIERIQKQSLAVEKRQLEYAKQTAEALGEVKVAGVKK